MIRIIFFILFITASFISCKENNISTTTNGSKKESHITSDIEPQEIKEEAKPIITERFVDEDRAKAKTEIENFSHKNPKPIVFLTEGYYIVDYIADGGPRPKDMIDFGEWYKFEKSFKYQHGFFNDIKDEGKYSYDLETKLLMMYPSDKKAFPSEWKVLSSGDVIVLVGTSKFGNNAIQKHTQNVKEKPNLQVEKK